MAWLPFREEKHLLQKILASQERTEAMMRAIWEYVGVAQSASISFRNEEGDAMPATIVVGGAGAVARFEEFKGPNGTGNPVPPVGPVVFASDSPAVATVDSNGNVSAVAPGTANISGLDQGNSLTASDVLTVTAPPPPVAQSVMLTLIPN
jgi:hypothetical protein